MFDSMDGDYRDPTARSAVSASGAGSPRTARSAAAQEEQTGEALDDYVLAKELCAYKNNYAPSHEENAAALDWIADFQNVRLNARLKSIYGLRLQHELTLARLRLLVFLGKYSEADSECVSMIKAIRSGDACGTKPKQIIKEDEGKTGRTNKTSATDATNAGDVENEDEEEVDSREEAA